MNGVQENRREAGERPAAGGRDPAEPDPAGGESEPSPPDDVGQPDASTAGLPPSANPANWVDHED